MFVVCLRNCKFFCFLTNLNQKYICSLKTSVILNKISNELIGRKSIAKDLGNFTTQNYFMT